MSRQIVCKFQCTEVAEFGYESSGVAVKQGERYALSPVYGKENEPWSSATPNGELKMYVTNPGAFGVLKVGKAYKITIEEFEASK